MEGIFALIGAVIGFYIISWVFGIFMGLLGMGAKATGRAVKKAVTGKETYFGEPQLKIVEEEFSDSGLKVKKVMFRGRIGVNRDMPASYSVSAFDVTDPEKSAFIISLIDQAQEPETICYGQTGNIGNVTVGDTFTDWVQLGIIVPELIQTPQSGSRKIELLVRLFDTRNPPELRAGYSSNTDGIFYADSVTFTHTFSEKGYEEEAEDREEAQALSLKIGVAVAMADGTLDDEEGQVLKNWIIQEISAFGDEKKERLKKHFNDSLREAFALAETGSLALSPLVERLAQIGEKKSKYDAIELCFDVMAADGVADPEEMAVIRTVASALDLDMDEIEKMRESVTLNLSTALTSEEGLESLVGLEDSWSDEQKRKHLRAEFQKWSNRLNALPEGDERESAQSMLDNIAELRKKYG